MYTVVTFDLFKNEFEACGRESQFSHSGLRALFDYLEDREDATGDSRELDVIELCCDFTEYETADLPEAFSYLRGADSADTVEDWIELLETHTDVILVVGSDLLIIQNF
jgi:hypothetical protein